MSTRKWPKHTKLKPGEFKATCRMGQVVLTRDMTSREKEHAEAEGWARTFGYRKVSGRAVKLPAFVRPDCAGLEFHDPVLFEAHVADVHRKKATTTPTPGESTQPISRRARGRWRAPKLTPDGRPFEPIGLEPGVEITWTELVNGRVSERTGQVWSAAERGTAWVVPDEPLEGELCVRLELTKYGDVIHRETRQRKAARSAA